MKKTVEEVINYLNKDYAPGPWVAMNGVQALTNVEKNGESFSFLPASGTPIKVFLNKTTGEVKLFPALLFEDAF
jgi:hypothetical protein